VAFRRSPKTCPEDRTPPRGSCPQLRLSSQAAAGVARGPGVTSRCNIRPQRARTLAAKRKWRCDIYRRGPAGRHAFVRARRAWRASMTNTAAQGGRFAIFGDEDRPEAFLRRVQRHPGGIKAGVITPFQMKLHFWPLSFILKLITILVT